MRGWKPWKPPCHEEPHLSQERRCPAGSSPSAKWQRPRRWAAAPPPPPRGPPWSGGPSARPPWASHRCQRPPWPSAGGWGGTGRLWEREGRRCWCSGTLAHSLTQARFHGWENSMKDLGKQIRASNVCVEALLWNNCWRSGQGRRYCCVQVTNQDADKQDGQGVACCNKVSPLPSTETHNRPDRVWPLEIRGGGAKRPPRHWSPVVSSSQCLRPVFQQNNFIIIRLFRVHLY